MIFSFLIWYAFLCKQTLYMIKIECNWVFPDLDKVSMVNVACDSRYVRLTDINKVISKNANQITFVLVTDTNNEIDIPFDTQYNGKNVKDLNTAILIAI